MRVETFVPYALDLNLGAAYNRCLGLLGPEDWAIFMDHDAMPTTPQWYRQIVEAIAFRPQAGAFVAMANRIGPTWQQVDCPACFNAERRQIRQFEEQYGRGSWTLRETQPRNYRYPPKRPLPPCAACHDMRAHRDLGAQRLKVRTLLDITDTKGWGGVLFAVSVHAWRQTRGFADGLFCVDHSLHFQLQALGYRTYLIEGLLVYHWRRAAPKRGEHRISGPIAQGCPCAGPEAPPTIRLTLPRGGDAADFIDADGRPSFGHRLHGAVDAAADLVGDGPAMDRRGRRYRAG